MEGGIPPPEERFHENVIGLTQLVYDLVDGAFRRGYKIVNPNLVALCEGVLSLWNKRSLIDSFIKHSHIHWDQIHRRDENFFEHHAKDIFKGFYPDKVDAFKQLFTLRDSQGNHVIKPDDRDAIWEFFTSLIKIAIHYIHDNRKPRFQVDTNGVKQPVYMEGFFDEVDLVHHARVWGIDRRYHKTP
jgi:hypothetical protein